MEDHVGRIVEEKAQLSERLLKLRAFTASRDFVKLPPLEQVALERQEVAMTEYCDVLTERLWRAGVGQMMAAADTWPRDDPE